MHILGNGGIITIAKSLTRTKADMQKGTRRKAVLRVPIWA